MAGGDVEELRAELERVRERLHAAHEELSLEVSARLQAEVELRNLAEALEQRVAERTAELQASYERLQVELAERRRAEEAMARYAADLARSNADLERFAYVSSHDLQEPLRAVMSYTQLLARRYQGQLDGEADEFIGFIVEGAARMQQLIRDLLTYSRIGAAGHEVSKVDTGALVDAVIADLRTNIEDTRATVAHGALPTVTANASQLRQLFQNLIANALKFRREAPPRIEIAARRSPGEWVFSVSDNGIGIEPQYLDRIFVIFQRLHSRETYAGSGIGLSICKRIVERHGGRIWVETTPGEGSTFSFSLPDEPGTRLTPDARTALDSAAPRA